MQALVYDDKHLNALKTLATDILTEAQKKGATGAEVDIGVSHGLSTTVRLTEVETLEYHRDRGIGITVYFGQKKGNASSTDLGTQSLKETLEAACHIAQHTESDPFAGLAPANKMAYQYPELALYHPWELDATTAIQIAKKCEETGLSGKQIKNSEGATLTSQQGAHVYANSHGFVGGYASSRHSLNCILIAGDDQGIERDYDYSVARDPSDLNTPENIGYKAAKKARERLKARRLKTQKVPVIFLAEVASSLWGHFFSAISGSAIYRRASFLLDSVGKKIFPEIILIKEYPHLKKGLGSAPFDAEGVATYDKTWVEGGIVQQYVLNSYFARKLGLSTTGNAGGLHNIEVAPTSTGLDTLLSQMGTGLLVTELMGQGVNKVTGDYSRGAVGFWIENGAMQYPVHEITIADNLKTMYTHIIAVGNDIDTRGNIQTGSVLIESMTVAGH